LTGGFLPVRTTWLILTIQSIKKLSIYIYKAAAAAAQPLDLHIYLEGNIIKIFI
jgi:hypothetical protein